MGFGIRSGVCATVLAVLGSILLVPAPASAQWTAATRLSGTRDAHRWPEVASDLAGDAAVAWTRLDPYRSESDTSRRAEAWLRVRVDGDWRRGRRISTRGIQARVLDVALDDDGDGWVLFTEDSEMYLRRLHRSGRVGATRYLGSGDHGGSLSVDGTGNVLAAWLAWAGTGEELVVTRYVHRGGRAEPLRSLGPHTGYAGAPAPALAHDGDAGLVAYGAYQWVAAARMTDPGVFAAPETLHSLPDDEQVRQLAAFVDGSGTGTVVFGTGGTVDHSWLYGVRLRAGQQPTSPWQWASGRFTNGFRAAMDRSGDIQVGWVELADTPDGWRQPGYTMRIPAGGPPGTATQVVGNAHVVTVALRRNGSGLLGWIAQGMDARPRVAPFSRTGSVGPSRRAPVVPEEWAQVRTRFLVAHTRSSGRGLGEAVWVRQGP